MLPSSITFEQHSNDLFTQKLTDFTDQALLTSLFIKYDIGEKKTKHTYIVTLQTVNFHIQNADPFIHKIHLWPFNLKCFPLEAVKTISSVHLRKNSVSYKGGSVMCLFFSPSTRGKSIHFKQKQNGPVTTDHVVLGIKHFHVSMWRFCTISKYILACA